MDGEINEFEEMLGLVDTSVENQEETAVETVVETAATEAVETAAAVETPAVEAVTETVVETTTEPTEVELLRAEIARLSGLVATGKLNEGTTQVFPAAEVQQTEAQQPKQPVASTVDPLGDIKKLLEGDLLSADELDAVIDKPELLNAAYKRANETLVKNLFGALPQIVNSYVQQEIQVNKLVTTFYEMNSDLKPYGDFVRLNMAEVERANPTKTYGEIFELTAEQCRKRLGLKQTVGATQTVGVQSGGKLPAAFAGSKSNSSKAPMVEKKAIFDENALDLLNLR